MFKVIIAGGRDFCCYNLGGNYSNLPWDHLRVQEARKQISSILNRYSDVQIVDGGAKGADRVGRMYSNHVLERNPKLFKADWKGLGKRAGFVRNAEMADYADALIAFWDDKSKGTKNMIDLARKQGLKIKIFYY